MKTLSVIVIIVVTFLGAVSLHWGITRREDTASGPGLIVGVILISWSANFAYRLVKNWNKIK